jgi:2,4-dienoyl-CoA reductase-like NADH-dependent reductase (Old Yellow Enzyme family)
MCQYSAVDGVPQEWHHTHLTQFASGGAGIVIAEATAVSPEGRISPQDAGIWNDVQRDAWAPIAAGIRARGALAGIQLAHAGRKASTWAPSSGRRGSVASDEGGWQTLAPSAVSFDGFAVPESLTLAGIDAVVDAFAAAARRAIQAGFEVIEIHAAHGYLLHQFLSPLSNRRDDDYGGSLENRSRLLLRVIDAVRDAAPDAALFVRFSASDWADGGWDADQTSAVARWAADHGADFFDISSGGLVAHQQLTTGPGYQVALAAHVRRVAGVPVSAVGMIDGAAQAEQVLQDGAADAVMAGREWLRDPHYGLRAAAELAEDIDYWPVQYLRARR